VSAVAAWNGDVRIAYDVRGAGEPLLLIHGWGYGRWGWAPVVDPLAEDFTVIAFDNRGIGESDVPDGPYTTAQMAGDAAAVLDAADLPRAHVVGTSLGGMIAQELALLHPERVDRLVLACTTPGGERAAPMPLQTVELLQEGASLPPDVALRRFVANALAPDAPDALVDEIVAARLANPFDAAGWAAQGAAGAAFDAYDRLGAIESPTLVVHGTADAVVDPRNSELLAALIPDARLEWVDGGGHLFFWEQPGRFVEIVRGFLA
jgi:3-oxoadipate enol-lactonase